MLTYRSRNSFESRFGRKLQSSSPVPTRDTTEASGERGRYNPNQVKRAHTTEGPSDSVVIC